MYTFSLNKLNINLNFINLNVMLSEQEQKSIGCVFCLFFVCLLLFFSFFVGGGGYDQLLTCAYISYTCILFPSTNSMCPFKCRFQKLKGYGIGMGKKRILVFFEGGGGGGL